jgi:hypothetical protein
MSCVGERPSNRYVGADLGAYGCGPADSSQPSDAAELAHETYVNATMEKISLLRLLKTYEAARREEERRVERQWGDRLDVRRGTAQAATNHTSN